MAEVAAPFASIASSDWLSHLPPPSKPQPPKERGTGQCRLRCRERGRVGRLGGSCACPFPLATVAQTKPDFGSYAGSFCQLYCGRGCGFGLAGLEVMQVTGRQARLAGQFCERTAPSFVQPFFKKFFAHAPYMQGSGKSVNYFSCGRIRA